MPQWGFLSPQKILATVTAVGFAYINFRGASGTGKIGNIIRNLLKLLYYLFYRIWVKIPDFSSQPRLEGYITHSLHLGQGGVF